MLLTRQRLLLSNANVLFLLPCTSQSAYSMLCPPQNINLNVYGYSRAYILISISWFQAVEIEIDASGWPGGLWFVFLTLEVVLSSFIVYKLALIHKHVWIVLFNHVFLFQNRQLSLVSSCLIWLQQQCIYYGLLSTVPATVVLTLAMKLSLVNCKTMRTTSGQL